MGEALRKANEVKQERSARKIERIEMMTPGRMMEFKKSHIV